MATQGGGGDEKPKVEGSELSQPADLITENDPSSGSQQKLPFITPEPLREDQVQNAVKFLSHPKVRGSPVIYRRSFLERKGLTKEEIDEAFQRVPDPPPSATTADPVPTTTPARTSTSLQSQAPVQPPLPTAAQVGVVSLAPTSHQPRFSWSHALIAFGVLSASGAGSALLFKKAVLPRLKAWIRRVAVEENLSAKEVNASKSLAEETAEAAKAAASAAAIAATASQEFLNSKKEDRKYFEAFMGMIDVQMKEMKSMSEAIHRIGKARDQEKMIEDYAQYATSNGTTNNSWRTPQVNQTDMALNQVKLNGTPNIDYGTASQSVASASAEPLSAPHSKSYMEEINDMPPNPNQPPSKPAVAPKSKPWEISQQNGKPQDAQSEPWWRKKSVKITELDPEGEEPLKQGQRAWIPPQPPSVAIPESAAAIRHPKPPPPAQEQHSGDEKVTPSSPESDGVTEGESSSGGEVVLSSGGAYNVVPDRSEIEEERADVVEVM